MIITLSWKCSNFLNCLQLFFLYHLEQLTIIYIIQISYIFNQSWCMKMLDFKIEYVIAEYYVKRNYYQNREFLGKNLTRKALCHFGIFLLSFFLGSKFSIYFSIYLNKYLASTNKVISLLHLSFCGVINVANMGETEKCLIILIVSFDFS